MRIDFTAARCRRSSPPRRWPWSRAGWQGRRARSPAARPPLHHRAEMLHLPHDRVRALHRHRADVERLPPRPVLGTGDRSSAAGSAPKDCRGAGDHVAVLVVVARISLVLLGSLLPAARAGGGIREHEAAERAPSANWRLMATVSSTGKGAHRVRGDGLHGSDFPAQHAQVVHLVDHVEQDRPRAGSRRHGPSTK